MNSISEQVQKLKKQKDVLILAHYYVNGEVQDLADYVGDSYYLSKIAAEHSAANILFCGVKFMAESAKILSPEKIVMLPKKNADCPMAHMVDEIDIMAFREKHPDAAVVCYINSTTESKACVDVCVTSSNAYDVISKLPQKKIFFVPDKNLGQYLAKQLPEKEFYFHDGYCHIHNVIDVNMIKEKKKKYPNAKVLMHPECPPESLLMADYIGSTSGIINYPSTDKGKEYIIATENGVLHQLKKSYPDCKFHMLRTNFICPNMKKISVESVLETLEKFDNQVELDEKIRLKAASSLTKMLELAQ